MSDIVERGLEPDTRPYYAIYARYHSRGSFECETFDEALRMLKSGEDAGEISMVCVMQGDEVVIDRDALLNMAMNGEGPWKYEEDDDD